MRKWSSLCAFGCFTLGIWGCTLRDVESPADVSNEGRPERQRPSGHPASTDQGVSTLRAETGRAMFDAELTDQLEVIDGRIRAITPLYEKAPEDQRDLMSERMRTLKEKRDAIEENRKALELARNHDWERPKADVVTNVLLLQQALDDLELMFGD